MLSTVRENVQKVFNRDLVVTTCHCKPGGSFKGTSAIGIETSNKSAKIEINQELAPSASCSIIVI